MAWQEQVASPGEPTPGAGSASDAAAGSASGAAAGSASDWWGE